MIEKELNKRFKLVLRNTKESDEANAVSHLQFYTNNRLPCGVLTLIKVCL